MLLRQPLLALLCRLARLPCASSKSRISQLHLLTHVLAP